MGLNIILDWNILKFQAKIEKTQSIILKIAPDEGKLFLALL